MQDEQAVLVLAVVLGGVSGFILALVLASRGPLEAGAGEQERQRLRGERAVLEARHARLAEALRLLPDLVGRMLSAGGRRGAAPLALELLQRLLEPEQGAIFLSRPAQKRLALAAGRGLPPSLVPGSEIEYGQGRVGHVAEARRAMDETDFRGVSELLKRQIAATEVQGLRAELVAPIVSESGLIGVVCAGGVGAPAPAGKGLLKMVADLTAVALGQHARLRAVEEAAHRDEPTGVYNKRYLQRRLGDELRRAEREGGQLTLLMIDLDHFRSYNDANGSRAGDELLRGVGELLRGSVREDDVAARYGGEEFAILYPGAGRPLALRLAEGIRHAVESSPFPHRERQPLGAVTVSGGVATFPDDARTAVDLICAADIALARAKAAGRNRIHAGGGSPDHS